jgi:hypothetical protein
MKVNHFVKPFHLHALLGVGTHRKAAGGDWGHERPAGRIRTEGLRLIRAAAAIVGSTDGVHVPNLAAAIRTRSGAQPKFH